MRGKTIADVAKAFARSGATGEVAVVEGDGVHWTMTVLPSPPAIGSSKEDSDA
ncbi:hypothetical protein [Lentzea sp. NPDC059081]|uniref:hypothetical protein n=1 Tax=Lentzea sp. NPDC059081 TaxID=3346719 RepID=UPI0036CC52E3